MCTAWPALRLTVSTVPGRKHGAWAAMAGTSAGWAEAGVGGEAAATTSTRIVFSLSVKLTPPPSSRRAQPSGILSRQLPAGALKGTKAWVSGMSPGVFTSALPPEAACWDGPGQGAAAPPAPAPEPDAPGGAVDPGEDRAPARLAPWVPEQDPREAATTPATATPAAAIPRVATPLVATWRVGAVRRRIRAEPREGAHKPLGTLGHAANMCPPISRRGTGGHKKQEQGAGTRRGRPLGGGLKGP